jgi:hypothetical protein
LIKHILKLIIVLVCVIPCVIQIKNSYEPYKNEFNKYLLEFNACLSTQKEIDRALSNYGRSKAIFQNVRSDKDFKRVEKELIEAGCLDKNYNKAPSEDCLFIIEDGYVCCVCHSDIKQIKDNIEWVKRLVDYFYNSEKLDYFSLVIGGLMICGGLWGF